MDFPGLIGCIGGIMIQLVYLVLAVLFSTNSFAYPTINSSHEWGGFPLNFTAGYNFEGIVALSNCSGGLIRLENSKDTDKAMVLTNGHCLETGFPSPGTAVVNQPSSRRFNVLDTGGNTLGTVTATLIMYSTMTKTDMTVYQLQETFGEIQAQYRVRPFTLSSHHPQIQDAIQVISGYWRRGFSCAIETFAYRLKEADWTNEDSLRYSRPGCETYGGTSGAPVVLSGTRFVIGVNNTGNESGGECTENNPCEVDEQGKVLAQQGFSYGQQTYWLYTCVDEGNNMNMNKSGCLLQR